MHKKKALLSSCKGFERYFSKDIVMKLAVIKDEVHYSSMALEYFFADFTSSVLELKTRSVYVLSK